MSKKYKFQNPEGLYFITNTVINWIDLFTRVEYCDILVKAFNSCIERKGLHVHAWVIMPSHFHAMVSSDWEPLEKIMQALKSFTSREFIKSMKEINESRKEWLLSTFQEYANRNKRGSNYLIWQDGSHPIEIEKNKEIENHLDYIHQNPVKAGYVSESEHWIYSSAIDYTGLKGLIVVEPVD